MIGLLFTGGTISMKVDPATGAAVPAMGATDILAHVPHLDGITDFEVEDVSRLPGPHVTPDDMWNLARRATAWLLRPEVDGLVITHGTDTIEETAYLLDLLLTTDKPVVLVGAMRTVSDPSWDGPANVLAAARVAASPAARGQGTMVVMSDQILPARDVRKVHTEAATSFAAPEFGPLGAVDAGEVVFHRTVAGRPTWQAQDAEPGLRVARLEPAVDLIQCFTGMDDRPIRSTVANAARGLALIGFGRGNVPPAVMPTLTDAIGAGLVVTVSSRSGAGRVAPRYGYAGGGRHLLEQGAILAGSLPGAKARLLMMAILSFASGAAEARELIRATVPDAIGRSSS